MKGSKTRSRDRQDRARIPQDNTTTQQNLEGFETEREERI